MRIGIATGFCTVGNFGSETRLEYTAIGSGVNTASRLEAAAENGEILMSFDTYSLVSDQIPCQGYFHVLCFVVYSLLWFVFSLIVIKFPARAFDTTSFVQPIWQPVTFGFGLVYRLP